MAKSLMRTPFGEISATKLWIITVITYGIYFLIGAGEGIIPTAFGLVGFIALVMALIATVRSLLARRKPTTSDNQRGDDSR